MNGNRSLQDELAIKDMVIEVQEKERSRLQQEAMRLRRDNGLFLSLIRWYDAQFPQVRRIASLRQRLIEEMENRR